MLMELECVLKEAFKGTVWCRVLRYVGMKGFLGDEKVGMMFSVSFYKEMDVCPKKLAEPLLNVKHEVLLIHGICVFCSSKTRMKAPRLS